jgi:hypothetical protein
MGDISSVPWQVGPPKAHQRCTQTSNRARHFHRPSFVHRGGGKEVARRNGLGIKYSGAGGATASRWSLQSRSVMQSSKEERSATQQRNGIASQWVLKTPDDMRPSPRNRRHCGPGRSTLAPIRDSELNDSKGYVNRISTIQKLFQRFWMRTNSNEYSKRHRWSNIFGHSL